MRWLVMCARGVFAVQRYFVSSMLSMPYVLRNSAADAPAGPLPTISTSVSSPPSLMRSPLASRRASTKS